MEWDVIINFFENTTSRLVPVGARIDMARIARELGKHPVFEAVTPALSHAMITLTGAEENEIVIGWIKPETFLLSRCYPHPFDGRIIEGINFLLQRIVDTSSVNDVLELYFETPQWIVRHPRIVFGEEAIIALLKTFPRSSDLYPFAQHMLMLIPELSEMILLKDIQLWMSQGPYKIGMTLNEGKRMIVVLPDRVYDLNICEYAAVPFDEMVMVLTTFLEL